MIQLDRDGAIATITLARAEARNAMPISAWLALAEAAGQLAKSDARVVLLRSSDPSIFSAGADIAELGNFESEADAARFREAITAGIEGIAALPMPVIAIIEGGCFGAAVALSIACDLRIAGEQARFAVPPAKLGIGYPRRDVMRLRAQIGRGTAARLLFTGDVIDAQEARSIGLIEILAADAAGEAYAIADRIAQNAPGAIRLLKRTLDHPADIQLDQAFDLAFSGAEFAEGFQAFRERRRPKFL